MEGMGYGPFKPMLPLYGKIYDGILVPVHDNAYHMQFTNVFILTLKGKICSFGMGTKPFLSLIKEPRNVSLKHTNFNFKQEKLL